MGALDFSMQSTDQRILDAFKLKVLEEQRYLLCKSIIPDRHYPYLRSKAILSLDDCEEIDAERTTRKKAARFLDIMVSKGPSAYDHLCESLMLDTTQMHLLKRLNTEYEDKKNKYLALVTDQSPQLRADLGIDTSRLPRPNSSDV
ncbi:B-cell lymphoma/leukemia 10-like [Liolophura sinensis]|uniref:B-cell lymphoma/leukemia 10-like n=1 Tax=Liolophura sinensis TaxID=3198878 RepID=UPI003159616E